jgi:Flp pilus assembly protein TadG
MRLNKGFLIMMNALCTVIDRMRDTARKLSGDNRGVAAVEFAFIAPLLITLYLGTLEVSGALQMNKRVGRAASTTADIIGQLEKDELNKSTLEGILKIGKAVTQPYNLTQPKIIATGVAIDAGGDATVLWSRQLDDATFSKPYVAGVPVTIPEKVKIANTFLIKVEAKIDYHPLTTWSIAQSTGKIDMGEVYYLRPRQVPQNLECSDC